MTYAIPPVMHAAIAAADAALSSRKAVDAALQARAQDRQTAESTGKQADADFAEAEGRLALAMTPADAKRHEADADAAAKRKAEVDAAIARLDRLTATLQAKVREADKGVTDAHEHLKAEVQAFRTELTKAFSAELAEAIKPLLAVVHRAHAINAALPGGFLGPLWFGDLLVPDVSHMNPPLVRSDYAGQTWRADIAATTTHATLAPLAEVERRLRTHRPFTPPLPPAEPYVCKSRGAGYKEPPPGEADWQPPKSTWQPQRIEIRHGGPNGQRPVDLNIAGAALAGNEAADNAD